MRTSVPTVTRFPISQTSRRHIWTDAIVRLETMWQVYRERQALRSLDERMLKDLGLDRGQIEAETGRSFFDVPDQRV
ncbi:MAG: DUF1127 domain-containing protein [Hyphomicrobiaceae bacterium]